MTWPAQGTGVPKFNPNLNQGEPQEFVPFSAGPLQVANIAEGTAVASGVGLLASGYPVPAHGTLSLAGWLASGSAAFTVTVDGVNYAAINQGNPQSLAAWYAAVIWVAEGDDVNLAATASGVVGALRAFFTPST